MISIELGKVYKKKLADEVKAWSKKHKESVELEAWKANFSRESKILRK